MKHFPPAFEIDNIRNDMDDFTELCLLGEGDDALILSGEVCWGSLGMMNFECESFREKFQFFV